MGTTCCLSHELRLSHCLILLNRQRQSPRRYDSATLRRPRKQIQSTLRYYVACLQGLHGIDINHTRDIYRCYVHDRIRKFARFQFVKNRASSKRLNMSLDFIPTQYPLRVVKPHGFTALRSARAVRCVSCQNSSDGGRDIGL